MSTIIKFELKELRKLSNDKDSCVVEKKVTQNLALQPWCLGNLKESIKNSLDYKIGKFDKEHDGILLSYKNLRVLQNVGAIKNDNADINFQVQAEYFLFRPHVGATLRGIVNKKSITHLGVLVHRVFNVVIPRPTEEPGNKWIGSSVEEGQEVVFRIVVLDLFGALPYIRGELDERSLQASEDADGFKFKQADPITVSYVHFDKTKPFIQKPIGDGLPHHPLKTPQKSNKVVKTPVKNRTSKNNSTQNVNGTPVVPQKAKVSSDISVMTEKAKTKRESNAMEADATPIRQKKKNKRES